MSSSSTATTAEKLVVGALFVFAVAARLTVAWLLPPWQGPDEPRHFEYTRLVVERRAQLLAERRFIADADRSPALQASVIESMGRNHYWHYTNRPRPGQLPTKFEEVWPDAFSELGRTYSPYPYLTALVLLPFEARPLEFQLWVVRAFSALLSALAVPVTFLAAKALAPHDRFIRLVAAAFVATLPMHVFMGGVVNPDALATLVGSLVLWGLLQGLRHGFSTRTWALVAGGILASFVAKRTGIALVVPAAVAAVGGIRGGLARRYVLGGAAACALFLAAGVATATAVPPFDRPNRYFLNEPDQITRLFDGRLTDPRAVELIAFYAAMLHASFWGVFGWFSVRLPDELYEVLAGHVVLAAVGLAALGLSRAADAWLRRRPVCRRELAMALLCPTFALTLIVLAMAEQVSYFRPGGVPQGRYLLIGVAAIAASLATGWRVFLPQRVVGSWGPTAVAIAALLALDAFAWLAVFVPYYVDRSVL